MRSLPRTGRRRDRADHGLPRPTANTDLESFLSIAAPRERVWHARASDLFRRRKEATSEPDPQTGLDLDPAVIAAPRTAGASTHAGGGGSRMPGIPKTLRSVAMGGRIARSARFSRPTAVTSNEAGCTPAHVWIVKRVRGIVGRTKVTMECALCGRTRVLD